MHVSLLEYLVCTVCSIIVTLIVVTSDIGPFRRHLSIFFATLTWALITRLINESDISTIGPTIIITPFTIGFVYLVVGLITYKAPKQ